MYSAKFLEYVTAYDRRRAALLARRDELAASALALVPALANICREYGANHVRLFGSLVTGRYGSRPDIDLAVDGLPPDRFFDLLAELQVRAAPIEVDLVDMPTASAELNASIEVQGQPV
jgi:predicted nucleotidyltransferase